MKLCANGERWTGRLGSLLVSQLALVMITAGPEQHSCAWARGWGRTKKPVAISAPGTETNMSWWRGLRCSWLLVLY